MKDVPFTFNPTTWPAYHNLPHEEQEAIRAAAAPFANRPEEEWPRLGARRIEMEPVEYQIRVGDRWVVYLRPNAEGVPELTDFVTPERLKLFAPKQA
jgi:hypothetical protein